MSEQYKDWVPGRKVRCIDNTKFRNRLSVGMEYEILEVPQTVEDKTYIAVTTNNGVAGKYSIFRFELLPLETPLVEEQRPEGRVLKHGNEVVVADHVPTYKELQGEVVELKQQLEASQKACENLRTDNKALETSAMLRQQQIDDANRLIDRQREAIEKLQSPKPTLSALDIAYTPSNRTQWDTGIPTPKTLQEALDRLASALNWTTYGSKP